MSKQGFENIETGADFELTVVQAGALTATIFKLEPGENLIGRWDPDSASFPEIDLTNHDPEAKVSRKHGVVIFEEGRLTFEDLGSLNFSYLRSKKGAELKLEPGTQHELCDGDELVLGKTVLRVRCAAKNH